MSSRSNKRRKPAKKDNNEQKDDTIDKKRWGAVSAVMNKIMAYSERSDIEEYPDVKTVQVDIGTNAITTYYKPYGKTIYVRGYVWKHSYICFICNVPFTMELENLSVFKETVCPKCISLAISMVIQKNLYGEYNKVVAATEEK